MDKLTLAALEATLTGPAAPVTQALAATAASIRARAEAQAARLAGAGVDCQAVMSEAAVGGGGGPGVTLPSAALSLPERLAAELRSGAAVRRGDVPAVVGRIEGGRLLLDLRAVAPADDERLAAAVLAATVLGATVPGATVLGARPRRPPPAGASSARIATAGHVDHGKSMLVRALTGMEPDRWEAEQRRGMTIDLGFAWMTLPSVRRSRSSTCRGTKIHNEHARRRGPAPGVLFVVAADEGWMPQSAEHLAAIDALGVRNGLLVVTRSDLADPAPGWSRRSSRSQTPASARWKPSRSARSPAGACPS